MTSWLLEVIDGAPVRKKRLDVDAVNDAFSREFGVDLIPQESMMIEQVETLPVLPEGEDRYRDLTGGGRKDTLTGEYIDPPDYATLDESDIACFGGPRSLL